MFPLVTPIGSLLFPLGICLLVLNRKYLFYSSVVSVAFFDCSLGFPAGVKIIPVFWFGGLYILKSVPLFFSKRRLSSISSIGFSFFAIFLLIVFGSIFMAVFYEGQVNVMPFVGTFKDFEIVEPLKLSMSNFTQTAYLVLMSLLTLTWALEISCSTERCSFAIKLLLVAILGVFISGILTQVLLIRNLGLATEFYRIFVDPDRIEEILARTTNYNDFGGYPRMYSLCGEPNFTANLFLVGLTQSVGHFVMCRNLQFATKGFYLVCALLSVVGCILCGSTGGYVGLILVVLSFYFLIYTAYSRKYVEFQWRITLFLSGLVVLVIGLLILPILAVSSIGDYVFQNHVTKIASLEGSGSVRIGSILQSLEIFGRSPLLGVGFGSHRSVSVLTLLLANTGMLGAFSFLGFNGYLIFGRYKGQEGDSGHVLFKCAAFGIIPLLSIVLIATPAAGLLFGWYWLLVAILLVYRK